MTPEDFKNVAEGVQASLLAIGALVGGVWVLLRFRLTREVQRASIELERMRAEVQRLRGVTGEISVTSQLTSSQTYYIYMDITLTNLSDHVRVFRVDDFPFHINKVSIEEGDTEFQEIVRLRIEGASMDRETSSRWLTTLTLLPGTPRRLSLFYELENAGNYLFSLVMEADEPVAVSPDDRKEIQRVHAIYDEYRDNPYYDPRWPFTLEKHSWIGSAVPDATPRDVVSSQQG